jgi:cytochrome bd ubiquinol oxidase subunit II
MFFASLKQGREVKPFVCALGLFLMSYIGLGIDMWPMMIPLPDSIRDAAAPASTQRFSLVGVVVLLLVILIYTGIGYCQFRRKVAAQRSPRP